MPHHEVRDNARQMEERYPERHPSRQLITRWFNQVDPEAFAALSTASPAACDGEGTLRSLATAPLLYKVRHGR